MNASPYLGAPPSDAGLSQAAQHILTCLNAMSTPLADVKRIPTPSASPYASFLDSSHTSAFHEHRPNRPPASALNTPAKAGIQSNISEYVLPPRGSVDKHHPTTQSAVANKASQQPSIFSVAAAPASRSSATSSGINKVSSSCSATPQQNISTTNPLLQPRKPDGLDSSRMAGRQGCHMGTTSSSVGTSSSSLAVSQQATMFSFGGPSDTSVSAGGGKMKSENSAERCSARLEVGGDEIVVAPVLPNSGLPQMNFTIPFAHTDSESKSCTSPSTASNSTSSPPSSDVTQQSSSGNSASPDGLNRFKFSVPEVLGNKKSCSTEGEYTSEQFKFSDPASVLLEGSRSTNENFVASQSSATFVPMVKPASPAKNDSLESTRELITKPLTISLFDWFIARDDDSNIISCGKSSSVSKESSTDVTSSKSCESAGWGDKFKVAAGLWECGACLIRNKAEDNECFACKTSKPGASNPTTQVARVVGASSNNVIVANEDSVSKPGFGDLFKNVSGEWYCDTCLLRNKSASEKCVACQTLVPGCESTSSETSSTNAFPFGVKSVPQSITSSSSNVNFDVQISTVGSNSNNNNTTTTSFTFGIPLVTSSSSFGASSASVASVFGGGATSSKVNSTTTTTSSIIKDNCNEKTGSDAVTSTAGLGIAFKRATGEWECSSCLVNNKSSAAKCIACEAAKPGAADNQAPSTSVPRIPTTQLPVMGFGDKFKKAQGDWECELCLVSNKAPSTKCLGCESLKPGSVVDSSKVLTGNFIFGSSAKSNEAPAFKFGVSFDAGSGPTSEKSTSTGSGFSFGVSTVSPARATSLPVARPALAVENAKSEFSFGVKSTTTLNNGASSIGPKTTNVKAAPSSPNKTTSVLSSGDVLDFPKNSSDRTKENTIAIIKDVPSSSFGAKPLAAKTTESGSSSNSLPTFSFGSSISSSQPSTIFGGSSVTTVQANDSTAKPLSIFPSFHSVPSTVTVTTNHIIQHNKTINRRSLDDTEDDALTSGKRNSSSFCQNNGIAEHISNFSFGRSSVAASATDPLPMFQFGASMWGTAAPQTVPAFGATAFGETPTPNFLNNNTISNITSTGIAGATASIFAFGLPPEKKPSASFDFGEALPPVPAFNFTPSAASASFQFAQNNDNGGTGN